MAQVSGGQPACDATTAINTINTVVYCMVRFLKKSEKPYSYWYRYTQVYNTAAPRTFTKKEPVYQFGSHYLDCLDDIRNYSWYKL